MGSKVVRPCEFFLTTSRVNTVSNIDHGSIRSFYELLERYSPSFSEKSMYHLFDHVIYIKNQPIFIRVDERPFHIFIGYHYNDNGPSETSQGSALTIRYHEHIDAFKIKSDKTVAPEQQEEFFSKKQIFFNKVIQQLQSRLDNPQKYDRVLQTIIQPYAGYLIPKGLITPIPHDVKQNISRYETLKKRFKDLRPKRDIPLQDFVQMTSKVIKTWMIEVNSRPKEEMAHLGRERTLNELNEVANDLFSRQERAFVYPLRTKKMQGETYLDAAEHASNRNLRYVTMIPGGLSLHFSKVGDLGNTKITLVPTVEIGSWNFTTYLNIVEAFLNHGIRVDFSHLFESYLEKMDPLSLQRVSYIDIDSYELPDRERFRADIEKSERISDGRENNSPLSNFNTLLE